MGAYVHNTVFQCMFSKWDSSIHMYLLDFRFTTNSLIVIYVTGHCLYLCMPELHHLIMYTCDCLSTLTGFILCTRWVIFWQPWTIMSRSKSLECGGFAVANQSAQWKRELAIVCPDPLFFQPLDRLGDSHLATREYFPIFYIAYHAFVLLDDLIFLEYCIILCDNCVLVLLLLECILPLCFRTLILTCTDA